jgi:hypothetical protein
MEKRIYTSLGTTHSNEGRRCVDDNKREDKPTATFEHEQETR